MDRLIQEIADKVRGEIAMAIDVLVDKLRAKDTAMTRTVICEYLVEIKTVVEASVKKFAEQANARMDEREAETEKRDVLAAQTERNEAQEQLKEISNYYRTALEILERDAGVSERDVEWASGQVDPLDALVQQRVKRKTA